jgi:hypothetical protein
VPVRDLARGAVTAADGAAVRGALRAAAIPHLHRPLVNVGNDRNLERRPDVVIPTLRAYVASRPGPCHKPAIG